jgi:hypothetical protein
MGRTQATLPLNLRIRSKRELFVQSRDWRWFSARYYESDGQIVDPLLPKITPLPPAFWLGP